MRHTTTTPTGVERTFGHDELIVTKTDLKGRITYANDVFLRVSAYDEDDVLDKPHNIIRHPDMPRCLFSLLWKRLEQRHEMFAYVVNLASDGAHYWVFAHVTPSYDLNDTVVGYHSNRRVPSRAAIAEVEPLYRSLAAVERRHQHTPDAIAASTVELDAYIASRGSSYDEMVWSLTGARA